MGAGPKPWVSIPKLSNFEWFGVPLWLRKPPLRILGNQYINGKTRVKIQSENRAAAEGIAYVSGKCVQSYSGRMWYIDIFRLAIYWLCRSFLVGGLEHFLCSIICYNPSHWRTPWFFRGVGQPPTRLCRSFIWEDSWTVQVKWCTSDCWGRWSWFDEPPGCCTVILGGSSHLVSGL
jgi:hypothetical protein